MNLGIKYFFDNPTFKQKVCACFYIAGGKQGTHWCEDKHS